jgi:hypothetical protein
MCNFDHEAASPYTIHTAVLPKPSLIDANINSAIMAILGIVQPKNDDVDEDATWCGASLGGSKSNVFNPSLGLKNSWLALIFWYIPYIPSVRTIIFKAGIKQECISVFYIRKNCVRPLH